MRNASMTILIVLALCGSVWAVEVLEPGYVVQTYATYSEPGIGRTGAMTFAGDGNLYATHRANATIWRIAPGGVASEFVNNLIDPIGIEWAGGTSYGNYLYVVEYQTWAGAIIRVGLDGTTSTLASLSSPAHASAPLGLDRTGSYNGHLYFGSTGQDHTFRVDTAGNVTMFSNFPGWTDGGGPTDIAFDTGTDYGGLMYMTTSFSHTPRVSGVFTLDTSGNASRFAPALVAAQRLAFDPLGDFSGGLFVVGRLLAQSNALWRVGPDGTATEFARGTISTPYGLAFGPDGAMYVAEYNETSETVIISQIRLVAPREVAIDIKPGSCPNPLNVKSRGVLPVAILGSEDLDVNTIEVASIRLAGVAPVRNSYEDVATPVPDGNECECTTEGPDGYTDLALKFKTQDIVSELGEVADGEVLVLTLTGCLFDGTIIEGQDCIVSVGNAGRRPKGDLNADGMIDFSDFAIFSNEWLSKFPLAE